MVFITIHKNSSWWRRKISCNLTHTFNSKDNLSLENLWNRPSWFACKFAASSKNWRASIDVLAKKPMVSPRLLNDSLRTLTALFISEVGGGNSGLIDNLVVSNWLAAAQVSLWFYFVAQIGSVPLQTFLNVKLEVLGELRCIVVGCLHVFAISFSSLSLASFFELHFFISSRFLLIWTWICNTSSSAMTFWAPCPSQHHINTNTPHAWEHRCFLFLFFYTPVN